MFVICSAFVINSITQAKRTLSCAKSQTTTQGPFPSASAAKRQVKTAHTGTLRLGQRHRSLQMGAFLPLGTIDLTPVGEIFPCFFPLLSGRRFGIPPSSILTSFSFFLLFTPSSLKTELLHQSFGEGEKDEGARN